MRIVVSGGGTAGHIYPASTVAARLRDDGHEVVYVGTPDGLESRIVPDTGLTFTGLPARGFDRSRPLSLVSALLMLLSSTLRAISIVRRADVVVGFGGYVSLPVGMAAVLLRRPLCLHEQNSVPGLANRVLGRHARTVALTYPGAITGSASQVVTGNPVRSQILHADRAASRNAFSLEDSSVAILVFGGSRGARHLNQALVRALPRLLEHQSTVVLHVAGRDEVDAVRETVSSQAHASGRYRLFGYLEDMAAALAASDIVVSRAGATSIAEITAMGRASILVPYPFATDDHQTTNAAAMGETGAALMLPDSELDGDGLVSAIEGLVADPATRSRMAVAANGLGAVDATDRVVRMIVECGRNAKSKEQS